MNDPRMLKVISLQAEDRAVDVSFARLGECFEKKKSYVELLTAFVDLKIGIGEEYSCQLISLSPGRLRQWKHYFEQEYALNFWRLMRYYEASPAAAVGYRESIRTNPFNLTRPFSDDQIMGLFAQLNNVIYQVYEATVKLDCFYRAFAHVEDMRASVASVLKNGVKLSAAQAKTKSEAIALVKQNRHVAYMQNAVFLQKSYVSSHIEILVVIEKLLRCEITLYAMRTPTLKLKACCVLVGQQLTKKLAELEVVKPLLIKLNGLLHIDDVGVFQERLNKIWSEALLTVLASLRASIEFVDGYLKRLKKLLGADSFLLKALLVIKNQDLPQAVVYMKICTAIQELYFATKCTNHYLRCEKAVGSPFDSCVFAKHYENLQAGCIFLELDERIAAVLDAVVQKNRYLIR